MSARFWLAMLTLAAVMVASGAWAKCYRFSKGGEIQVCIKGDSFADRKKAKKICDKAKGSDCGNVSSYSSSCHSNTDQCYDEKGKKHRTLSGY
jgi:hypothetical protein